MRSNMYIETEQPEPLLMPRVAGVPVVRIWSVKPCPDTQPDVLEIMYAFLPLYWSQEGILDCKLLQSSTDGFLIIESWKSPKDQVKLKNNKSWQDLMHQLEQLEKLKVLQLKEIANDTFDLIE